MTSIDRYWLEGKLKQVIGTSLQLEDIQMLGGGCINSASQVKTSEGSFFVKWNHQEPEDIFLREAECLRALGEAETELHIPKVYYASMREHNHPALLITEFLERGTHKDDVLGRGLAQLHRSTREEFGFDHNNYCGATLQNNAWKPNWVDFYRENRIGHLLKLLRKRRKLSSSEESIYAVFLEKLPNLIPSQPKASLIHGDLWSGNYLFSSQGPSIIDPASCYADREFEFGITTMFGGFSSTFWNAYQNEFPLPPGWKDRNLIYQLYHYLNHYYLFGGGYGQSALQIAKRFI